MFFQKDSSYLENYSEQKGFIGVYTHPLCQCKLVCFVEVIWHYGKLDSRLITYYEGGTFFVCDLPKQFPVRFSPCCPTETSCFRKVKEFLTEG